MENEKNLPKEYKGYSTVRLLRIWEELQSPQGTGASKDEMRVMSEFLREYKLGIHGLRPASQKP